MSKVFKFITTVSICVAVAIVSPLAVNAQSTASSSCPQPDWESILGYQPFGPEDVDAAFIVFWANFVTMDMLSQSSEHEWANSSDREQKLRNMFTEEGRQSLRELHKKLAFDLATATTSLVVIPIPAAAAVIKMQGQLPDKDGDGISEGRIWRVLGKQHLTYTLVKTDAQGQVINAEEIARRAEVMTDIIRPRGQDRLYIAGIKLVNVQDVK